MIDDSRTAYVLGYYPTLDKWDGRFREIKVKVNRPGVEVRHRRGYMAVAAMADDRSKREQALLELARSQLSATGIGLTAQIEPTGSAREFTVNVRVGVNV